MSDQKEYRDRVGLEHMGGHWTQTCGVTERYPKKGTQTEFSVGINIDMTDFLKL